MDHFSQVVRAEAVALCAAMHGLHMGLNSHTMDHISHTMDHFSQVVRAEAVALCAAMHGLHMGLSTPAELATSTAFLMRAHPLNWTPPRKKSVIRCVANRSASIGIYCIGQPITEHPSHLINRLVTARHPISRLLIAMYGRLVTTLVT
jgi:hypothetical protein